MKVDLHDKALELISGAKLGVFFTERIKALENLFYNNKSIEQAYQDVIKMISGAPPNDIEMLIQYLLIDNNKVKCSVIEDIINECHDETLAALWSQNKIMPTAVLMADKDIISFFLSKHKKLTYSDNIVQSWINRWLSDYQNELKLTECIYVLTYILKAAEECKKKYCHAFLSKFLDNLFEDMPLLAFSTFVRDAHPEPFEAAIYVAARAASSREGDERGRQMIKISFYLCPQIEVQQVQLFFETLYFADQQDNIKLMVTLFKEEETCLLVRPPKRLLSGKNINYMLVRAATEGFSGEAQHMLSEAYARMGVRQSLTLIELLSALKTTAALPIPKGEQIRQKMPIVVKQKNLGPRLLFFKVYEDVFKKKDTLVVDAIRYLAQVGDVDTVKWLIQLRPKQIMSLIRLAIRHDSSPLKMLPALLPLCTDREKTLILFHRHHAFLRHAVIKRAAGDANFEISVRTAYEEANLQVPESLVNRELHTYWEKRARAWYQTPRGLLLISIFIALAVGLSCGKMIGHNDIFEPIGIVGDAKSGMLIGLAAGLLAALSGYLIVKQRERVFMMSSNNFYKKQADEENLDLVGKAASPSK
jgi:hypothetical protein